MGELVRQHAWSATPLGARETWAQSLRTTVDIMLSAGHAMCVMWGPDRIFLYNDAYAPILGARHPEALGQRTQAVWAELWDGIGPLVERTFGGETLTFDSMPLTMTRNGYEEETWWDFSYSPVRDERGAVTGLLNVTSDATARVVAERERAIADARLRDSEERLRALVNASANVVYTMSGDWRELKQLDGRDFLVDADAPTTGWLDDYVLPEDQAAVGAVIDNAITAKKPFEMEHRVRAADGSIGWAFSRAVPLLDNDGSIAEWFGMAVDVTARHEAVTALHESETFTRSILASSTDCIKVLDLEGRLTFMSEGGQQVMEVSDFNAIAGCPWPDFWQGQGNAEAVAAIKAARRGESRSFLGRAFTFQGTPKWWHVAVSPIPGPDGKPARILSVSRDITALRASEEERDRFKRLAENSTDFVAMAHLDGTVFYVNDAGRRMIGLEGMEGPFSIPDFFAPEEAARNALEVLPAVKRDGHWVGELDFRHFQTGELIPVLHSVFSIPDTDGEAAGYGTVTIDFRDRKRTENDMRLMNGELAHRLKNVLAVIQSVANQTLRTATDLDTAGRDLASRLAALGAATDVLTGKAWRSADLRELIQRTLAPHGAIGRRILVAGPEVTLKPEVSVAFALSLHELATNAGKYGALSNDAGQVNITWAVTGTSEDADFTFCWREEGGPEVSLPKRKGFGSNLIERSLRSYFRGRTATDYRSEGLVFELSARLGDAALVSGY